MNMEIIKIISGVVCYTTTNTTPTTVWQQFAAASGGLGRTPNFDPVEPGPDILWDLLETHGVPTSAVEAEGLLRTVNSKIPSQHHFLTSNVRGYDPRAYNVSAMGKLHPPWAGGNVLSFPLIRPPNETKWWAVFGSTTSQVVIALIEHNGRTIWDTWVAGVPWDLVPTIRRAAAMKAVLAPEIDFSLNEQVYQAGWAERDGSVTEEGLAVLRALGLEGDPPTTFMSGVFRLMAQVW